MQLFEAIVQANQRVVGAPPPLELDQLSESLPVVALTCIDPRLNQLVPDALGLPEDQFIWLRNAGNILTGPMSSTMRSLALACAVKGGKEIAIIGHTDCRVRSVSMVELPDRFKALGIPRSSLPDNINEFFGLFASERQNVMRGVDYVRQSPIIGPKVPVHGLLIDIQTGRLEWVVNGYETITSLSHPNPNPTRNPNPPPSAAPDPAWPPLGPMPAFNLGEIKTPETPIGQTTPGISKPTPTPPTTPAPSPTPPSITSAKEGPSAVPSQPHPPPVPDASPAFKLDRSALYKIIGDDKKVYGPVTADELERWIAENRIDLKTLAQIVGQKQWRTLETFLLKELEERVNLPPAVSTALKMAKQWRDKKQS